MRPVPRPLGHFVADYAAHAACGDDRSRERAQSADSRQSSSGKGPVYLNVSIRCLGLWIGPCLNPKFPYWDFDDPERRNAIYTPTNPRPVPIRASSRISCLLALATHPRRPPIFGRAGMPADASFHAPWTRPPPRRAVRQIKQKRKLISSS